MRRLLPVLLLLPLLGLPAGALAQARFSLPETGRMRVVTRALGWTVLRDSAAPADAAETAMILIRAQRPVPPAARPGHLGRLLPGLRPFHFARLPAEGEIRLAGLPGQVIEAPATGQPSGAPVRVRAICLFGRERSWLLVASAPAGEWPALEPELARVLEGFRPG
ncbi:hypothetical protein [Roseicella frigidaeris]|uniref:Uncharacterized protein n=1 Tax=Roseicella frigidaeris TaxID=2230885 RepID=A0A327M7B0_9PROT|nr:hypothetical protein [Roseicella frigidaeris]RAI58194.1 hypothetical protein DOO78_14295 [Roseicella frigidaeris]